MTVAKLLAYFTDYFETASYFLKNNGGHEIYSSWFITQKIASPIKSLTAHMWQAENHIQSIMNTSVK